MAQLLINLTSTAIRGLCAEPAKSGGMRAWIEDGAYIPHHNNKSGALELQNVTNYEILPYLSYDFDRFSLASAESYFVFRKKWDEKKSISWPLIQLYYSAFFAAHAIMRSQGMGIVRVDKNQIRNLNLNIKSISGKYEHISSGVYQHMYISPDESQLYSEVHYIKQMNAKGSHDFFWKTFCTFLSERAELAVKLGAIDVNNFVAGVSELTNAISGNDYGTNSWLSLIRNQINYEHRHCTWFPVEKSIRKSQYNVKLIYDNSSTVPLTFSSRKKPIEVFINVCNYLALLNFEISDNLAMRSNKGNAFGKRWGRLKAYFM